MTIQRTQQHTLSTDFHFQSVDLQHPRRSDVEHFIASRFAAAHDAQIHSFMPQLITLFDEKGHIKSAIGIRSADESQLFLEHYLDTPIEDSIAALSCSNNAKPPRSKIVEVGNLASSDLNATRRLFELLANVLIKQRFQWIVFTGCNSLSLIFTRLHLPLSPLAKANQSRLPEEEQAWGHYYEGDPQVMAGELIYGKLLAKKSRLTSSKSGNSA